MKRILCLALLLGTLAAAAEERPFRLERDFGTLCGTLLVPDGGAEAVALIIAGSGPTDRNGNNPLGSGADTYRLLAEALHEAGIASLRYDKRAIGSSRLDDPSQLPQLTLDDYVADAAALADRLAAEGFRRVVLAGHSEGRSSPSSPRSAPQPPRPSSHSPARAIRWTKSCACSWPASWRPPAWTCCWRPKGSWRRSNGANGST